MNISDSMVALVWQSWVWNQGLGGQIDSDDEKKVNGLRH